MTSQTAPAAKPDNLLGICHAIGETFGFNPIWLRMLLLSSLLLSAKLAFGAYAVMGVAVLLSKLLTWRRKSAAARARQLAHA